MAAFETAVALVLRHEGGFVNNANDPGGATNFGCTQRVLSEFLHRAATADDVKNMSVETARQIYKTKYWSAIQGDGIKSQDVGNWCFDMSVLRGTLGATQSIQQVLGVAVDGTIGAKTMTALNKADPALFINAFRSVCVKKFADIVTNRPASLEFLNNWMKRAEEMTQIVSLLAQRSASPNP